MLQTFKIMVQSFQVVLDGTVTRFNFSDKVELVNKMVELQVELTQSVVTFLTVEL